MGEVNADGWGASGWGEGSSRTFRMYGATDKALNDVTYTIEATQGLTFEDREFVVSTPGGGQLPGNGYTAAPVGVDVTLASPTELVITLDHMPEKSSFSFGIIGILDDSGEAMVLHHHLNGALEDCEPIEPTVEETEWVDIADAGYCLPDGEGWAQERQVTTTYGVWNSSTLEFDEVVETTTETRERPLTEDERAGLCPTPTEPPTEEPTEDPTEDPSEDPKDDEPTVPTSPTTPNKPVEPLPNTGVDSASLAALALGLGLLGSLTFALSRRRSS